MTRAIAQLEARKTGEAIPHEMEALNGLLKAQAEVRRRQVMQQQANGANSGGNGRQGQDLSNLFDRELKRQQRTNYETQSQIEQQPEGQNTAENALDRIRDLARRQEELGRRQRELAGAGLSAEELKRQLETLTREQEQLRQQAEKLARDLVQQSQQSAQQQSAQPSEQRQSGQQPSGKTQPGQQAQGGDASSLRDAAEQMRDAASQLSRQDPASAAARSDEAARRLRDLENQMQSGTPDARRRALGDLQLESQQVAEAQRRIAQEADRLDREGGGTIDARRRLAGEKEQLAERVDALQQSAERLGTDPKSSATNRATVNEAVRDLQSQQLGARMRNGAREMRDQPTKRTAGPEQQLADALDRVARRLNGVDAGGAKGDVQRLADELDQVRDARDRLARLEEQVRQAERNQASRQGQRGAADGGASEPSANGERGNAPSDLQRLKQEYAREAQRTRDMVDRLQRGAQESSTGGSTPEQHEWSRSAPGTETWKQDYAQWDGLRKDVTRALERYEAGVADRLSRALTADRLRAGGSDRVPDEYQRRIGKYFESLAKKPGQQ
jgi:hypothetical protein